MRRLLIMLVVVMGVGSMAFGQATTMPAVDQSVKVLVIPFKQIGDNGHEWVGAAIHENLITQASGDSAVQTIGMTGPLNDTSPQAAISAAKGTGATLVVFGSFQFSGDQLRVNGRVMETNYGQTIGTLSATGAIIDLFKIEDTLSSQLTSALPQPPSTLPTVSYGPQQQPTEPAPQQAPVPYYAGNQPDDSAVAGAAPTYVYSPTYTYGYPAYSYPAYSYPDYSYPYYYGGYYGGYPIVIFNRGFRSGFRGPFIGRPGFGFRGGFGGGGFRGGFRGGFAGGGFHGGFAGGGGFHGGGGGHGR